MVRNKACSHVVELSLVAIEGVVLPVLSVAVLVADEAAAVLGAAGRAQGLTGRDVRRPEPVDTLVT